MENFSYHVPFYILNGGIATSGHSSELTPGKIGLFDRSTFSVATSSGSGKEFFLAQGRIGGVDWYGEPVTESHKSPFFMGKDVIDMYYVLPKRIQNEEWVINWRTASFRRCATAIEIFMPSYPCLSRRNNGGGTSRPINP